jgi:hypothetical protein
MAQRHAAVTMALVLGMLAGRAAAQGMVAPMTGGGSGGGPVVVHPDDPNDPRVQEYARQQKHRVEVEKELCKLRADYFGTMRNVEIRQAGISKLRKYRDPALYPSLLKIFKKEKMDVRGTILDMLADAKSDLGDTTLAWGAIFDESKEYRDASSRRLMQRLRDSSTQVTPRIKGVIAEGLKTGTEEEMGAAAHLAQTLKLYEAIPLLISAQVGGSTVATGAGGPETSLAWILVGTQTAYVSDLTPVVGDHAVGFDPTVSVVTEGTVLSVQDAVVITYRFEVHNALVGMSSEAWGQPTDRLGFDIPKWRKWYTDDFLPAMAQKQEAAKATGPAGGDDGKK